MRVLESNFGAKRASLTKTFTGGRDMLKIGGRKVVLDADIERSVTRMESDEMSAARIIIVIALALTLVGLILAIPLWFAARKKRTVMAFRTRAGLTFSILAQSNAETKVLRRYANVEALAA